MSHNSFGHIFKFTTWGESHGKAIGCVVDGTPPMIELTEKDIQLWLDKRRPGQNQYTSPRSEPDTVEILSGVYTEEKVQYTTGTPISMIIYNKDQKSADYDDTKEKFRPGHADYTYSVSYTHLTLPTNREV